MTRSIKTVLVANRGEIALRIMRSVHARGLTSVAVYSDADADAPFVRAADSAVRLGPAPARDSYLSSAAILQAARQTGADAVHPGYGFLAENAAFATAVLDAGLNFIGPPPSVIAALGDKRAAKALAAKAGVPIVPGYNEADQTPAVLLAAGQQIGFPLLVKATAGGGGKGMRIVRSADELPSALERAASEAQTAFGNPGLILERYVERPRHIEVQIIGDQYGNVTHLWERECSVQRRHQKVVEEAPAPNLPAALRDQITASAVRLAQAVGYQNAGTVEFIVDPTGHYYFLEVNTRLQVEHPVTELTTGVDLVDLQLAIAAGERLPFDAPPPQRGHAIEARWCAEDPSCDFLPTTGVLGALAVEGVTLDAVALARRPPGERDIRYDLGVATGSVIGIDYDSMLGKIIAHAGNRAVAAAKLRRALATLWAPGLVSNQQFLQRLLQHPAFVSGELDTGLLARHPDLQQDHVGLDEVRVLLTADILASVRQHQAAHQAAVGLALAPGFRNVPSGDTTVSYMRGDTQIDVGYLLGPGSAAQIALGGKRFEVVAYGSDGDEVWFREAGGVTRRVKRWRDGDTCWLGCDGKLVKFACLPRFGTVVAKAAPGTLCAPMPGKVLRVAVEVGAAVRKGDLLVILEAMKLEHSVRAGRDGTVAAVFVQQGQQVAADARLVEIAS